MARMEEEGVIDRVVPGIYIGANHAKHPLIELAAWTLRHPAIVGCLLTAAIHHRLTDAFERGPWLYVPKGTSVIRSRVANLHVIQTAPWLIDPQDDTINDIQTLQVHGVTVRLTGPDRTTLDLWKYPRLISAEYALDALRRRAQADNFHLPALARLAQRLHVWNKLEPVLQGLVLR